MTPNDSNVHMIGELRVGDRILDGGAGPSKVEAWVMELRAIGTRPKKALCQDKTLLGVEDEGAGGIVGVAIALKVEFAS